MINLIYTNEIAYKSISKKLLDKHPYIFVFLLLTLVPMITLLSVFACGMTVLLPLSYLFGWL